MPELFRASLPYQVAAGAVAFLLCLAPLLQARGRSIIGVIFLLLAVGLGVDVLVIDHTAARTVEVVNLFPKIGASDPTPWTMATVTAAPLQYHLFAALMLLIPGCLILLRRNRERAAPNPILHVWLVWAFFFVARLGLEKTGAPAEICWGVGGTPTMLVTLPFFGLYCGRRGHTFGVYVRMLLLLALAQRLVLVTWGYFATTRQLGTHLDTHVVNEIQLFGAHKLDNAFDSWLWPTLVPHLTMWIAITLVAGIVLGGLPRWSSSRKVVVVAGH